MKKGQSPRNLVIKWGSLLNSLLDQIGADTIEAEKAAGVFVSPTPDDLADDLLCQLSEIRQLSKAHKFAQEDALGALMLKILRYGAFNNLRMGAAILSAVPQVETRQPAEAFQES